MRKTAKLLGALFPCFLIASLAGSLIAKAQYTPDGEGFPLVSPITVISPANCTYNTRMLTLNFTIKSFLDSTNAKITIGYSIDGNANTTINPKFTFVPVEAEITYANGTTTTGPSICSYYLLTGWAALPELPNGAHNITVYARYQLLNALIGLDNKTVYFAVSDGNAQTMSPTLNEEPPQTANPNITASLSPSSSYAAIGVAIIIAASVAVLLLRARSRKEESGFSHSLKV